MVLSQALGLKVRIFFHCSNFSAKYSKRVANINKSLYIKANVPLFAGRLLVSFYDDN